MENFVNVMHIVLLATATHTHTLPSQPDHCRLLFHKDQFSLANFYLSFGKAHSSELKKQEKKTREKKLGKSLSGFVLG